MLGVLMSTKMFYTMLQLLSSVWPGMLSLQIIQRDQI